TAPGPATLTSAPRRCIHTTTPIATPAVTASGSPPISTPNSCPSTCPGRLSAEGSASVASAAKYTAWPSRSRRPMTRSPGGMAGRWRGEGRRQERHHEPPPCHPVTVGPRRGAGPAGSGGDEGAGRLRGPGLAGGAGLALGPQLGDQVGAEGQVAGAAAVPLAEDARGRGVQPGDPVQPGDAGVDGQPGRR